MLRLFAPRLGWGCGEGVEAVTNRINSSDLPPREMLRHPQEESLFPPIHPEAFLWVEDPLLYHAAGPKRTVIHPGEPRWECYVWKRREASSMSRPRGNRCHSPGGQLRTVYKGTFSIRKIDRVVLATAGSCQFWESVRSGSGVSCCSYRTGQSYRS